MKVQSTNLFQYPAKTNSIQRLSYNNSSDTFERSNNHKTLNFKGGTQNIYKKIIESPTLSQKFTALMSMAIAALVAGAASDDNNTETTSPEIGNNPEMAILLGNMLNQKTPESKPDNTDEVAALKKENQELKATIETLKKDLSTKSETDNQTEQVSEPVIAQKVSVIFPKKIGRLTAEQINLKSVVEKMSADKEYAEKLELICSALINNKDLENKKELTASLAEELSTLENDSEITKIIDNYYNIVFPPAVTEEDIQKDAGFIRTEVPALGVNIVGKIDLSPEDAKRQLIRRDTATELSQEELTGNVYSTDRPDIEEEHNLSAEVDKAAEIPKSYTFSKAGVQPNDLMANLTQLYLTFQNRVYKEEKSKGIYVHWSKHSSVCVADKKSIIRELRNNKNEYQNLNTEDADLLLEMINGDPRIQKGFTLHGILRLIERFVDMDSLDQTPEEQLKEIIDALEIMIKRGITKESIKCATHVEHARNSDKEFLGMRLELSDIDNRTMLEKKYFNKSVIALGVCEDINGHIHDKKKHGPVIHTLFSSNELFEE